MADALAKTKTGWGASRANYMAELIAERLTETAAESYINAAMQWGIDHEAEARSAYEFRTDCEVAPGGFVLHPVIGHSGASPDGFVGPNGLVEFKCPNTATHIDTLLGQAIPGKYITQMQWQMACTDRQWCDFVSYDPRLPEPMRLFCKRLKRDDAAIEAMAKDAIEFLQELDARVTKLRALYFEPTVLAAG
jgi:predicted phage-related endonuclease